MKKIVILCAGDFGREIAWLIEDINAQKPTYEILGFLDDDWKDKYPLESCQKSKCVCNNSDSIRKK